MRNLAAINDDKDLVTKEYVDGKDTPFPLEITDPDIDLSTTPSTSRYDNALRGFDANGDIIWTVDSVHETSGAHGFQLNSFGGNKQNSLQMLMKPDGTASMWISQPAVWRNALGAAASSHSHGNITSSGDITATAPTVASGDCLVINDDSASKITNGPAFGTSTTTYLRNDGTWATPAGGGGGGGSAAPVDVLYNNDTGSSGPITLSSSIANYDHMRIYYGYETYARQSVDVYNPNGKQVSLFMNQSFNEQYQTIQMANAVANGTTLTLGAPAHFETNYEAGTSYNYAQSSRLRVYRVEAWNYGPGSGGGGALVSVLYYNASGTTGTVTLSQSAANFDHMRIYARKVNDQNQETSVDVYQPNGKSASLLSSCANTSATNQWITIKNVTISGTSITNIGHGNAQVGSAQSGNADNQLAIYRVEAWNEGQVGVVPTGTVSMFAGSTAPTGYLLCQGQAVSRATYAALFAAIGTAYGSGDGSTTFNLPNLQGKFALGKSSSYALGSAGGASTVTLTTNQIPAHTHGSKSLVGSLVAYSWGDGWANGIISSSVNSKNSGYYSGSNIGHIQYQVDASHEHDSVGGGASHDNMPPYQTVNYIIKT